MDSIKDMLHSVVLVHPFATVAAAFAVGFIGGLFVRAKRKKKD